MLGHYARRIMRRWLSGCSGQHAEAGIFKFTQLARQLQAQFRAFNFGVVQADGDIPSDVQFIVLQVVVYDIA